MRLGKPVSYLNDGNAGALWGHFNIFGATGKETSVTVVIGTGLGGGVILDGNVIKGRKGFGGELGHVLIPYQSIAGISGMKPKCNCGRIGCLESVCSLTAIERDFLPFFLPKYPGHELGKSENLNRAAKMVRGLADKGDPMCQEIFRVQAHALGLFFDEMINTFDPDALIVGGGAIETTPEFQKLVHRGNSRRHAYPTRRAGGHSHFYHAQRRHGRRAGCRDRSAEAGALRRAGIKARHHLAAIPFNVILSKLWFGAECRQKLWRLSAVCWLVRMHTRSV